MRKKLSLNNLKIREKLLLIYVFCVLIPIICTDITILIVVNRSAREKEEKELQYVMERIEYNLSETVNGCILFTNNLYNDEILDRFLNREYEDYISYYDAYTYMLRNKSLNYNYNNGMLNKIEIFTDNDSIINGGNISNIKIIKNTEWYKAFMESGQDIFLYVYYDQSKKLIAGSGPSRIISIIRKLNNFNYKREKILKVDIDYNVMQQDVLNEKTDAKIYVRNQDYVLFSNLPYQNSLKSYLPAASLNTEEVTMTKSFKVGKQDWEILIWAENTPFLTVIFKQKELILLVVLNIIIPSLLIYYVGISISKRLSLVVDSMNKVKKEQFEVIDYVEGEDEIGNLIHSYNLMVLKIRNLIEVVFKGKEEKQALELAKKQAELNAVQSQVNPHFLFNTLEAIRMRSLLKGESETADIIGELAILFRSSMDWRSEYISIKEEMSFVEKYINIQKYRFGDKITYHHYIMKECLAYKIPKLAISTFIENAFVHGIEMAVNNGIISVTITKNSDYLFIEISDNGKGFQPEKLAEIKNMIKCADSNMLYEAKSTGMLNAFLRLKMFTEGNIEFEVDSELENGTDILIKLPLIYVDSKEMSSRDKGVTY
ncbi:MAG: HAMP domain-containing protein [Lachnoclostridium sp.]|jgi:two-component system, sensor histidine kinase YesM